MEVDIDKAGEQVDKASNFFDHVNAFIKKHPIWFILLVVAGLIYWTTTLDIENDLYEGPYEDPYMEQYYEDDTLYTEHQLQIKK